MSLKSFLVGLFLTAAAALPLSVAVPASAESGAHRQPPPPIHTPVPDADLDGGAA